MAEVLADGSVNRLDEKHFAWLEDPENERLRAFLQAEKAILAAACDRWSVPGLDGLGMQENFVDDMPVYRRGQYFFARYDEGSASLQICSSAEPGGAAEVRIDLTKKFPACDPILDVWTFSDCERCLAFTVSLDATDRQELHVFDFEANAFTADVLGNLRFSEIAWQKDEPSFIYNRCYIQYDSGRETSYSYALFKHRIGNAGSEDELVMDWRSAPGVLPLPLREFRGELTFLFVMDGIDFRNELHWRPSSSDLPFRKIQPMGIGKTEPVAVSRKGSNGWEAIFWTTVHASNGHLVRADLDMAREISILESDVFVPEASEPLAGVIRTGECVQCIHGHWSGFKLKRFDGKGIYAGHLDLPGHAALYFGKQADANFSFARASYPNGDIETLRVSSNGVLPIPGLSRRAGPSYRSETRIAVSADGKEIPVSICFYLDFADMERKPVLLKVYGGFGLSMMLGQDRLASPWMKMGGIFAIAHVRGGGELGVAWHEAGRNLNKVNTIDDLGCCAALLKEDFGAKRLALFGQSHGGFVATAALNRFPGLFTAAIADVTVTDLLRHETVAGGAINTSEFGSVKVPGELENMKRLSPLHNLSAKIDYPPTLVVTGARDDRVPYWHAAKYAYRRRQLNPADGIYHFCDDAAGHGGPASSEGMIAEEKIKLSFLHRYMMSD